MSSFNRSIDKVKRAGRGLTKFLTLPLAGAGGLAVKTAADYETLQTSMNVLNGTVQEGARNFERLKRFSAETPFQLQDLAQAQNMLQGFGLAADEAFQSIQMIGDIAAVSGGSIEGIGIAFGQAAAEGRLMTRDIRQLINQGVPAIKLLADSMGVAENQIFDMASAGEITFPELVKAFQKATREGGMFADGMAKQAQTIGGLFSTLKDNVSLALAELGDSIIETLDLKEVIRNVTTGIKEITRRFSEMSQESRAEILKLAGMFMAGGPLIIALGVAMKVISAFSTFVTSSFFRMAAPVVGFMALVNEMTKAMQRAFPQMRAALLVTVAQSKEAVKDFTGVMGDWITEATGVGGAMENLKSILSNLPEVSDLASDTDDAADAFSRFTEALNFDISGIQTASTQAQEISTQMFEGYSKNIEGMRATTTEFSSAAEAAFQELEGQAEESFDAMQGFADMLGMALSRAVVQGHELGNILSSIARQLASKAIMTALSFLLPGGAVIGKTGFFSELFGGVFHQGGIVPGSGEKLALVQGGEGIFTPDQMQRISMGGGSQNINIHLTGHLRGRGSELEAVIREHKISTARLGGRNN